MSILGTIKNHPANVSISMIAILLSMAITVYQDHEKRSEEERVKVENLTLTKQIESLDRFQDNLKGLMVFVETQKEQLKESELLIKKLEEEKSRLQPLVNANRDVVEAMFKTQAEMQKQNVWFDRVIGFFLGIAGSLVASLIWAGVRGR